MSDCADRREKALKEDGVRVGGQRQESLSISMLSRPVLDP
jgi:hypothetical protein